MKENIIAVQKMQDYIYNNYESEITLSDLSKVSYFSPWYSYKLFKELTGISPAEYIRKLRLSKSALKLKNKGCKVIDVAFELGFKSVDGYQRAFLKEFGCNPKEYSNNPVPINLFVPYGVKFKEILKEKTKMDIVQSVFIQIIKKPDRKVIIKRGKKANDYFEYCEEVGCDVWGTLLSMSEEPVCMWLPQKYVKPNTSVYVQGVEVPLDFSKQIPDGFDIIELPSAEYLMFQGEPFKEENFCEAINAVQNAMDKYNPDVIGYEWDNENPRIQLEPLGKRGYIELKPVKKILK